MKGKILASSLAVASLSLAASSPTLSYLTDDDSAVNTFTAGSITIETNRTLSPNCANLGTEETCTETVSVENTGTSPAYVRVEVRISESSLAQDVSTGQPPYSLSFDKGEDWSEPVTVSPQEGEVNYYRYTFIRSEPLTSEGESGSITIQLTNHQVAEVNSGNVNTEECSGTEESCTITRTSGLVEAGVEVYTQAIQAYTGFESANEAFDYYSL